MAEVSPASPPPGARLLNRTVIGIVLATFFSDASHEMATAVLPMFLVSIGLGPGALGMIEGFADLVMSLSKLGGGYLGHYVRRKRPLAAVGYLVTSLATSALGLVHSVASLLSLRAIAWIARGYRSPLRDYLLSDAVEPTHYARAYGLERVGDMLGAMVGPLAAAGLIWAGIEFRDVILWAVVPGVLAASSMFFLTRERPAPEPVPIISSGSDVDRPGFPRGYWLFLGGVFLFGMGDFSRTFLIWLAAQALGETGPPAHGAISLAVLLYMLHNLVSATAAYPIGHWGDHAPKRRVLLAGYTLGVATNLLLAVQGGTIGWLILAIVMSAVYIAVEETIEKAAAAEWAPRELRSLGFGYLAAVNAVGDMASSLYVGFLLEAGQPHWAFGIAAGFGMLGVIWLSLMGRPQR